MKGAITNVAAFVLALAGLGYGCRLVSPALGWIVPSSVVLLLIVAIGFIRNKGGDK